MTNKEILKLLIDFTSTHYNSMEYPSFTKDAVRDSFKVYEKTYIYSDQSSLWGDPELLGFGTIDFYIKEIDRKLANKVIVKNHYSKKFYNATYIHLGLFVNEELQGVLQYGYAMNPASCGSVVKGNSKK